MLNIDHVSHAITFLRVIALLLIVMHHTLCVYYCWPPLEVTNVLPILPDSLILVSLVFKTIGLGLFTFIAGFLVSFTRRGNFMETKTRHDFIIKKANRILIPMMVWGLLYWFLFPEYISSNEFPSFINGTHLWYLPMLFLCFILILPILANPYLATLSIGCYFLLLFCGEWRTFTAVITYFPIFLCGYIISEIFERRINIALGALLFAVIIGGCYFLGSSYLGLLVVIPLFICMCVFYPYMFGHSFKFAPILDDIGQKSFGVYILHQFVINTLLVLGLDFFMRPTPAALLTIFCVALFIPLGILSLLSRLKTKYPFLKLIY